MLLLAHRGASADEPENTLAAFQAAVNQKADGVELDVRICASGELVVCHDDTLDRLASRPWKVERTPWSRLREADVGAWKGRPGERIPLLEEVLELLPRQMWVNVELKCETLDDRGLAEASARVLRGISEPGRVVVSSFHPGVLMRLARLAPKLKRGFLIDPDKPFWLHGGALVPLTASHSVHPHHAQCTHAGVNRWRQLGLAVAVWTVDDAEEARRLQGLGVSYCITNRPGALRQQLESRGP